MSTGFRPPVPVPIAGGLGGGGTGSGSAITSISSTVITETDPFTGAGSASIITNGKTAISADSNQFVIIGDKTGISPVKRLTIVDPTGQAIRLINSTTKGFANLTILENGRLSIATSGSGVHLESNNIYVGPGSIHIANLPVTSTAIQLNYTATTPGVATAIKALVVDANRSIGNINSLSASILEGTLLTGDQPNISSLNSVDINKLKLKGIEVTATALELNFLRGAVIGTAGSNRPLIVDSNKNISGINSLNATFLNGILQTGMQPNITSLGTLDELKVSTRISVGNPNPTRTIDILAANPIIRMGNGAFSAELAVDANGNYRISPDKDIIIASHRNMLFSGTSMISGLNAISATNMTGTLQTGPQPNITSVGTLSTLNVLGDVVIGSIDSPSSSRRLFINESNGQCITLARSSTMRCDLNINLLGDLEFNLHRDLKILNGSGLRMTGPIAGVTSLIANTITGIIQTSAQPNITSVGTLTSLIVNESITSNAIISDVIRGTIQTASQPHITSLGNLTSLNVINTISATSVIASSLSGVIQTPLQPNITSVGTLSTLSVVNGITCKSLISESLTGVLQTALQPKITLVGTLSSLNVTNAITAAAVNVNTITGTLLTSLQPNITSVGTLSSLNVSNEITAASVIATSLTGTIQTTDQPLITTVGALTSLIVRNAITSSSLITSTITGTLQTSSQPNITSIGTLDKLLTNGAIGIGVSVPTSIIDINTSDSFLKSAIQITNGTMSGSIAIGVNGITLDTNGPYVSLGSGVGLRFTGGSLIGLSNLHASSITGIIQTPDQPNIQSLGTLTHLNADRIGLGTDASEHYRLSLLNLNGKMITMSNGDSTLLLSISNGDYTIDTSNDRLALGQNVDLVLNDGTILGLKNLAANTISGLITTPNQPNITSIGNLSNLIVNGPITANSANITNAVISGDLTIGGALVLETPLTFSNVSSATGVFNSNQPAISSTDGGTLTVIGGAAFSNNVFIGSELTIGAFKITESTLIPLSNLTHGIVTPTTLLTTDLEKNLTGFNQLSAVTLGGILRDSFQPNITTIGNLTSLNVNGYLGVGTASPSSQLEINSINGNCLTLSYDKVNSVIPSFIKFKIDSTGKGVVESSSDQLALPKCISTSQIILGNSTNTTMPLEIGFAPFVMTQPYAYSTNLNARGVITPREPYPSFNYSIRALGRILCTQSIDVMSDRRTKTNITNLTDEYCSSFVENTNPVSFNWKEGDLNKSYGYIAQDIIRAGFPDLVNLTKDDSVKEEIDEDGFVNPAGVKFTVSYQHMIPILAKNQKRLMKENKELREMINVLFSELQKK